MQTKFSKSAFIIYKYGFLHYTIYYYLMLFILLSFLTYIPFQVIFLN